MVERPNPDDESAVPPDPAPGSDPKPTLAKNVKVTPLDEDKHVEDGIEVHET